MCSEQIDGANPLAAKYAGADMLVAIRAMKRIGDEKSALDDRLKEINKEYDFLRLFLVPKLMGDSGVNIMKVADIGRVQLTADIYASIPSDRREEAHQWLHDLGFGDLITNTVNPSTLKAFLKGRVKRGEDVPETLFKVTPFTRASITKT